MSGGNALNQVPGQFPGMAGSVNPNINPSPWASQMPVPTPGSMGAPHPMPPQGMPMPPQGMPQLPPQAQGNPQFPPQAQGGTPNGVPFGGNPGQALQNIPPAVLQAILARRG